MFIPVDPCLFSAVIACHTLWTRFQRYANAPVKVVCHGSEDNKKYLSQLTALNDFRPSPLYALDYYGLVQTIGQTVLRSLGRLLSSVRYERECFPLSDGGTIALDWVIQVDRRPCLLSSASPVVLIQHGLCGDSNVEYVIHLAEILARRGYRVAIVIARGCGGLKLTTPVPFSFGKTLDFKEVVDSVHSRYSQSQIFAVGFSLGACLTLRHVGVHGEKSPLSGAVCVSPPWDFAVETTFLFRILWTRILVSAIKLYFWVNRDCGLDPELLWKIFRAPDVVSYDRLISPIFGYQNEAEYYNDSSPKLISSKIRIPTLVLSAVDDPVCNIRGCPQDISSGQVGPGLIIAISELGGHLGFAEDLLPLTSSWVDRVCVQWLEILRRR
jgi:abhydrolase domain-containing protein 1/3